MRLSFILSGVKRRTTLKDVIIHHGLGAHEQYTLRPFHRHGPYRTHIRMASTLPRTPIFNAIAKHDPASLAIVHSSSDRSFSYGSLLHDVAAAKDNLTAITGGKSLRGERIAFLAENGYDYVVTFLSILAHNAIALPLAFTHPSSELRYILENSEAALVLSTEKFQEKAEDVLRSGREDEKMSHTPKLEILSKIETGATSAENVKFEDRSLQDAGFMLYTSGTTNRPKGVVLSVDNITAQAQSLIEAWRYAPSDLLLHVLPLHHIHGTINALFTPLIAGSTIEFAYPFNADTVFKRLALPFLPDVPSDKRPVTFLTVVPTIYNRLLASFPQLDAGMQTAVKTAISPEHMRVNISGSAALPTPTKQAWTDLSGGNVLLERYGMTEVGMALSCGLAYEDRVDGSVGWPLPSVQVRLVDTETNEVIQPGQEQAPDGKQREGEIQLRGPTIFREYFRNPAATASEFVDDDGDGLGKWFKTGDVAIRQPGPTGAGKSDQKWAQGPMYFIRGRKSVDIIKTGGEKVSALEVERELLSLPEVAEAAVVGIQNEQWGQKVAAIVVLSETGKTAGKGGKAWAALDMRRALKDRLANYKVPMELRVVDGIPRNAMGKVNKKSLVKEVFPEAS
ncbi:Acyl-CoA synthetase family member 3, mitochondrial [Cyphellophora attinorum]|uniref:Acyl-CoA synthetase family member 3, mitochondrial n=1 Tax=Cyphellophora attinorum TaxID=1664694 RepID=A0A0N1P1Z4_9EURO|nr:Acyl-CoA synthetase family member 3, mitochondrial [Phialophora attinorum]KPI45996.1 Acyl-CoA synthetase family member 3, mitochondrial [Phialophora attinorum]